MTDFAQWRIQAATDDSGEGFWTLQHLECDWSSNPQYGTDRRTLEDIHRWIERHEARDHAPGPRPAEARWMTWGHVPAGWYVQTPRGAWLEVIATHYDDSTGRQWVTHDSGEWARDPAGAVTACPGTPSPTDAAIAALGYPLIIEDGV